MGFETANIHLGSRSPADLIYLLDSVAREVGSKWLEAATERMIRATCEDHVAWIKRYRSA